MLVFAACWSFWAASAVAQITTITCFYTVPIAPGQRPAATPLVFKRADGYEVTTAVALILPCQLHACTTWTVKPA